MNDLVVRRYNPAEHVRVYDPNAFLGDDSTYMFGYDELGGFSLKKIAGNVTKAVTKAVKDVGHVTGNVVTSTVGKTIIGGALAATGVGIPLAAAIGAGTQAVGGAIKSGGGIKAASSGALQGAAIGAASGVAGKLLGKTSVGQAIQSKARGLVSKVTGGRVMNDEAAQAEQARIASAQMQAQAEATAAANRAQLDQKAREMMQRQTAAAEAKRAAKENRSDPGGLLGKLGAGIGKVAPFATPFIPGVGVVTGAVEAAGETASRARRGIKAADTARDVAGKARDKSRELGGKARSLGDKARVLKEKAEKAAAAGDALGAGRLADEARKVAETAATVQNAADNAAGIADRAGAAVVAATDAGIGAAATGSSGFGEAFAGLTQNPALLVAGGVGLLLLFGNRGSSGGGGYRAPRSIVVSSRGRRR